ncbi:MAG TPA: tetratricopeptide repeat protein [Chthoniobacterales bacterium]|nr:tetratricopeptide repeat protein [Chthoniobacterales bacterium]
MRSPDGTLSALVRKPVEASIATARWWFIIRPLLRMKKLGRVFLLGVLVFSPILTLSAQSEDPSELFLKAYMTSQQGEKLEHDGQFKAALAKYRFAGSLLEDLRKRHADWQPAIVEYRSRKVSENILRVQDKAATQSDLATGPTPLPGGAPILPERSGPEPSVEVIVPQPEPPAPKQVAPPAIVQTRPAEAPATPPPVTDTAIREATKKLQGRVDELQGELDKTRSRYSALEKEKEGLSNRLDETNSKLNKAQADLDKSKKEESNIREQLTQAQSSLKKVETAGGTDAKAQEALRAEIAGLKKQLEAVEQGKSVAQKERDQANSKMEAAEKQIAAMAKERDDAKNKATQADKQIAAVTKQRDDALEQLKGIKGGEQKIQVLMAENSSLKQKLADAEKAVRELSEDKPKKEKELADVKQQISQLQQQLAASQKENQDSKSQLVSLRSQLEEANAQLDQAKLTGVTAEETARLRKENQILRNIVIRERQEEARRDQAKKLMLAEFDKLKVKSDILTQQVELLAQPVTRLTDEELALLRQPVVSISDNNPAAMNASFAFAKRTTNTAAPSNEPENSSRSSETADSTSSSAAASASGFKPSVPEELVPVAREAKENFDRGRYRSAEKKYQEILTKSPNNLYSLSNLGVVYFRTGRLKAAELTLKKAVAIAPKDEFSHTTLGIVFYRQAKFDEALTALTKALAINPKSATAHNYLGITASQKGWQEAAEKEMLEAIANNPEYADAHFNLAVIYATAQPPARDLAKRHYAKATSLGAQPDPSLEKLLR